jgi:hypothetical protein
MCFVFLLRIEMSSSCSVVSYQPIRVHSIFWPWDFLKAQQINQTSHTQQRYVWTCGLATWRKVKVPIPSSPITPSGHGVSQIAPPRPKMTGARGPNQAVVAWCCGIGVFNGADSQGQSVNFAESTWFSVSNSSLMYPNPKMLEWCLVLFLGGYLIL